MAAPATRTLYVCDNLPVLRGLNTDSVDLIATDPPFNAKRVFNAPLGSKAAGQRFDDRWRWDEVTDEWFDLIADEHRGVKEVIEAAAVIEGGEITTAGEIRTGRIKNSTAAFLCWMSPRLIEMARIIKPTGSLYLHCDDAADSYLRLLLDAIFQAPVVPQRDHLEAPLVTATRKPTRLQTMGTGRRYDPVLRWSGSPVQGDPAPDADGSGEEVPVARRAR